jgi:TPR repeat protein
MAATKEELFQLYMQGVLDSEEYHKELAKLEVDEPPMLAPAASALLSDVAEWRIAANNAQQGPYSKAKLAAMLEAGEMTRDTLVWKKGMANWTAASMVSELDEIFDNMPPPLELPPVLTTVTKSAEERYEEAMAILYSKQYEQYGKALALLEILANEGLVKAQKDLGNYYNHLGVCYKKGKGLLQDYGKAAEWFRKAAEQGNVGGLFNLSLCYYIGQGVLQDYDRAVEWLRKAAELGYDEAQNFLGMCYNNGGQGVAQNYSKAAEWFCKAAEQGHATAQNNLGMCYNNGEGVAQDYGKAAELYRKAAEQGHAGAQCNLGCCYEKGEVVAQDYGKAVELYRKAAEQGHAGAQYYLGLCYYEGKGVAQDYGEAAEWYRKAAEQGNLLAKHSLFIIELKIKGKI